MTLIFRFLVLVSLNGCTRKVSSGVMFPLPRSSVVGGLVLPVTAICLELVLGAASTLRWLGAFMVYLYVLLDLIFPHISGSSCLTTCLLSVNTLNEGKPAATGVLP